MNKPGKALGDKMYFNRAGFGERLAAYLIDSFVVGIIVGLPGVCLGVVAGWMMHRESEFGGGVFILLILLYIIIAIAGSFLYYGLMWSRTGQTVGKQLMRIKVVTVDGIPPSFWLSIGRAVIGYGLSSSVFSLGFLWMLWDDQQQTWHDRLFGTYVVKV
jgi:uncharacterized RDD family membrane protein YckC